jgi:hypothetical protein
MRIPSLSRRPMRELQDWLTSSRPLGSRARRSAAKRQLSLDRLEERVLLHGGSPADSFAMYLPPRHDLVQRGGFLTAPTPGDPRG